MIFSPVYLAEAKIHKFKGKFINSRDSKNIAQKDGISNMLPRRADNAAPGATLRATNLESRLRTLVPTPRGKQPRSEQDTFYKVSQGSWDRGFICILNYNLNQN